MIWAVGRSYEGFEEGILRFRVRWNKHLV